MNRGTSRLTVKYGYRTMGLLIVLLAFSAFLLVEYLVTGENTPFFLALSIVFFLLTLILFVGFSQTVVTRIEKRYFHSENLIGHSGKILKAARAGERGTVNVLNEDWSFVCDSDTNVDETVTVRNIMDDKITLQVER